MHVLVVDDEPDIVALTTAMLTKRGYAVSSCSTAKDAAITILKKQFDIYLLDVHLPDGTGFELAEQIRQENNKQSVILMSAYDDVEEKLNDYPNVKFFLKKPFRHIEVLNAIAQV